MGYSMKIGERLRIFRKHLQQNQTELADILGIAQTTLSKYEVGTADIADNIKILLSEKGLNMHWLLTGEGEMISIKSSMKDFQKTPDDKSSLKSSKILILNDRPVNGIIIPFINQKVSAGNGEDLDDDDTPNQLITIPRSLKRYGDLKALEVRGDSMLPTLHDKDIVVCDSGGFDGDGIYVLKTFESEFVKRVILTSSGYQIISDNKLYPPYGERKEDTLIIGKVRGAFLKME